MNKSAENGDVLGVRVDISRMGEVLGQISAQCSVLSTQMPKHRAFWIVTAYSETFLEAQENPEFAKTISKADLVVLDGVGGWMAMDYKKDGLGVVWNLVSGKYADRPVGVEIVKKLLEERKYKIFLLGGFGGVAARVASKYRVEWYEGPVFEKSQIPNPKSQTNLKILKEVNKTKPDVLLVAFGRVKQEMWIAQNLDKLNCKVVIGVGSSFDEIMGEGVWVRIMPAWVEQAGVKWLWRLMNDSGHLRRVWRAVIVFPWRVFRASWD